MSEVATCRAVFLSLASALYISSEITGNASIPSAQHLYHRCRHTITITGFHNVLQRDRCPEGAASAELGASIRYSIMAHLRQGLHHGHGLPSPGLRLPAPGHADVDDEGEWFRNSCILHYNFRGKGIDAKPTSFQAERALHDPQLLPNQYQCDSTVTVH